MDAQSSKPGKALNPTNWVDQHGDYLYRYALSRLRDAESAEEVVQETFVAGLRHAEQYAGQGSERAWLLGILKRKIVDYVRNRSRSRSLAGEDEEDVSESLFDRAGNWRAPSRHAPADSLEREELWRIFRECLAGLPARQADVFALREMEQMTTEEICKDLEISPSNLWVLLYRARLRLSNCMKSRWQQEAS